MRVLLSIAAIVAGCFAVEARAATVNLVDLSRDIRANGYEFLYDVDPRGRYPVYMNMYDIIDVHSPIMWNGVYISPSSDNVYDPRFFSVASGGLYLDDNGLTTGGVSLQSGGFTSISLSAFATSIVSRLTFAPGATYPEYTPIYGYGWGQNGKYLDIPLISINGRYYTDREIDTGVYGGVSGVIEFESAMPYLSLQAVRTGSVNADPSLVFDQIDYETVRIRISAVTVVPLPAPFALLGAAMLVLVAAGGRKTRSRA